MFFRKVFIILFAIAFVFGCEKLNKETKEEKVEAVKERQEKAKEHPDEGQGLIRLSPDAVKQAGIKTEPVSLKTLTVEYTFSGKVSVNETRLAHVGPRIGGSAVEVYANLGDYVKKGEPLAVIDSPELGEVQSQYLKARTNLEVAEKSYERAKIILEGKVISTGEFQRREGEYLSAKTEAKAAEDKLHLIGMTEDDILAIGKQHAINSRVAVYAPISGTVIERHLTLGEVIEPVKPLFSIADLKNLWVIADIPERDIPKIKKGQGVVVTVSPYPDKVFRGKIDYIAGVIDPDTRTVKVRAEIENPPSPPFDKWGSGGLLKPEMFAAVKISTSEKEKLLAIPEGAVQREGEKTIVFIAKDEITFEKRVVEIGYEVNGYHQVLSGLKQGERIVIKGAFTLKSETMKEMMEEE